MIPPHFDATLEQFADSTALVLEDGSRLSYTELAQRVGGLQEQLRGDKSLVFIQCGANVPSVSCYLAALRAGQATLLINADLSENTIEQLRKLYQPDWIFEPVVHGQVYVCQVDGYGLRKTEYDASTPIHPDLALLLSTSGTTGSPKMVKLTKRNLYANAASIIEYLSLGPADRAMTTLPMHYSYGLSVLNTHLAVGGSLVITGESMMSRKFWEMFRTYKVTSFAGVPYHYEMLLRLRFFSMQCPSLRTMTQAGGRLAPYHVQEFAEYAREHDIHFFVMYGQTEATARISYLPADKVVDALDSIGQAVPGGRLWIQDRDGTVIEAVGQEGELVYQGPNVMMGYAGCRDDLAVGDQIFGILPTGDLARRDSRGFFTITGRCKRFVKIFGNRVNLDEVEQLLKAHGFDVLCGGQDDLLLLALTTEAGQEAVEKIVATSLGIHRSGMKTVVVEKIFRTDAGKIDYRKTFQTISAR